MGDEGNQLAEPLSLPIEWLDMAARLDLPVDARTKVGEGLGDLRAHHVPTYEHCMRVGIMAVRIGEVEGLPLKPLFYAGSSHDRGKILVPAYLLGKTSRWTVQDTEALKDHPVDGYEMVLEEGMAVTAGIIVLHHRFQDNPYPVVLPEGGPKLPEHLRAGIKKLGRIVALADFNDAAHRSDRIAGLTGGQIKDKIITHNQDVAGLVEKLYDLGIFRTDFRY